MTTHANPSKTATARVHQNELRKVLTSLVNSGENPEHLIELYYWSRKPGVLGLIRAFVSTTDASRDSIRAFMSLTPDPRSIVAKLDRNGCLSMTAASVAQVFAMADYMAAGADGAEPPRPPLSARKYRGGKRRLAA
jgi:hypothetical protein